jgi:hypothetical protein
MPIEINLESTNVKEQIENIFESTIINLNGRGPLIDVHAFLSTHTIEQAINNINTIRSKLNECIHGGSDNIKAIYLKLHNSISIPIYLNNITNPNDIKMPNNITKIQLNKSIRLKRLQKKSKSIDTKKNINKKKKINKNKKITT